MKAACLLFLTVSCAALMPGTDYAAPSNPASQQKSLESAAKTVSDYPRDGEHAAPSDDRKHQKDGKTSDEQRDYRHASDKDPLRSRASLTKANRPKQLPNRQKCAIPGHAMNLHQPGSTKSGGAREDGLIQNGAVNNTQPVRPPSVVRPTVQSPNNVRHRGANPAVIGGSANSDSRNTGAINGTRMIRRP
jgi:hypothetical protein